MKVTNITQWSRDNTLSEKFYKKLGFTLLISDEKHSILELNDFKVVLVSMRDEDRFSKDSIAGQWGLGSYLYIQVDDVDVKHRELMSKKLEPSSEPSDWEWGNREFVIKDPDGYKICFWQPIAKRG